MAVGPVSNTHHESQIVATGGRNGICTKDAELWALQMVVGFYHCPITPMSADCDFD